jgi:hypothetical protein
MAAVLAAVLADVLADATPAPAWRLERRRARIAPPACWELRLTREGVQLSG